MLKKTHLIIVVSVLLTSSLAFSGPFGLEMGMSLKDVGGTPESLGGGKYKVTSVPKPHSAFQFYIVQIAPKGGLCWIKAIGNEISTSVYGLELKAGFESLEEKLASAYGDHETVDRLRTGSIWNEPKDWMMALVKKERVLAAIWNAENGSSLPEEIESIVLFAQPLSRETGVLAVEYRLSNQATCEAEIAALEDDAL